MHLLLEFRKLKNAEEQIKGSIRYAKTIQQAMLPSIEELNNQFDSFIVFRPKDIVSGDFYWYAQVNEYIYIAVVDCTGHGVPGAFMSLIGTRLLDEIIIQNKISSPAEILTQINQKIKLALKQKESSVADGMDVCLCRFEAKTNKNLYSAEQKETCCLPPKTNPDLILSRATGNQ